MTTATDDAHHFIMWVVSRLSHTGLPGYTDPHPYTLFMYRTARLIYTCETTGYEYKRIFHIQVIRRDRLRRGLCPFCGVRPAKFDVDPAHIVTCPRCLKRLPREKYIDIWSPVLDPSKTLTIESLGGQRYE